MAMGKALVILATSCAALSSQPMAATTRGVSASQPRSSTMRGGRTGRSNSRNNDFNSSLVALHYRDGDADQSAEMQSVNRQAINTATVEAASNSNLATPTLDGEASSERSRSNFTFKSLPTIVNPPTLQLLVSLMPHTLLAPPKVEDEQQLLMDEYLEFYDRRYSRLHPRHRTQQSSAKRRPRVILDFQLPRKIFLSAVAFHRPSSSSNDHSTTNQQQPTPTAKPVINTRQQAEEEEDPLNVLGLSNLASAKLRQRLHVPRDLRDEHMLLTSGTTSAVKLYHYMTHTGHVSQQLSSISERTLASISGKDVASTSTAPTEEGGRTSSYISLSFPAQLTLLVKTLQRMTLAFVNTMKILTSFASRMFSEILEKGGFRHSVRMMSMASLAVLLMFRPLFNGALKQG